MSDTKIRKMDERGNYHMLMGLMLVVMFGFGAFAIDMSLIATAEIQTQAAADAASHAALVIFRETKDRTAANDAALEMLDDNMVMGAPAQMEASFPKFGSWDDDTRLFTVEGNNNRVNSVQVEVARSGDNALDLILAPIAFNHDTHDTFAASISANGKREIMLVTDMSCSMQDVYATFPSSASSHGYQWPMIAPEDRAMYLSRKANLAFLDYIANHPQPGDHIGLALYSVRATLWLELSEVESEMSAIRTAMAGVCSEPATYPSSNPGDGSWWGHYHVNSSPSNVCMSDNLPPADYVASIPRPSGNYADSGTAVSDGLFVANVELKNSSPSDQTAYQAIVMFSDGEENNGAHQGEFSTIADDAWDNDIHIWSVLFQNGDVNESLMQAIVRGDGEYYNAPEASDLEGIMIEIASSIPLVMVK